jgi:hypothetical protein
MSTLWFDVMNLYCDDPDWSNLPDADNSGIELLSSDDEILDEDPDWFEINRIDYPQHKPKIEKF